MMTHRFIHDWVRVMAFNATFNNISVLSWRSVLLLENTVVPRKTTDLPQATDKLHHNVSGDGH